MLLCLLLLPLQPHRALLRLTAVHRTCAVSDICRAAEEVFDHSNHFEHLASVRSFEGLHTAYGLIQGLRGFVNDLQARTATLRLGTAQLETQWDLRLPSSEHFLGSNEHPKLLLQQLLLVLTQ